MRYTFVLNPAAQSRRAGRQRPALEKALREAGVDYTVEETGEPGHATRLARAAAASSDIVVAVGGDGTIQEVARGVYGTGATMGVLPLGTGNDFAHAVGMPDDLGAAVRALLAAEPQALDLGRVRWLERADGGGFAEHDALFTNCLGAGFDALAALGAQRYKYLGGRTAYLAAVLRALWLWRQPKVSAQIVVSDEVAASVAVAAGGAGAAGTGEPDPERFGLAPGEGEVLHDGPFFLVEVGNGFSVGGGFLLTPDAVVDDGLLDVCLADYMTTGRALRLLPKTLRGAHLAEPEVMMRRTRRVTIRATAPLPVQADGEALSAGARALDVTVLPGTLRLLAPAVRRPGT